MSFQPRRYIPEYKPPAKDSPRARAQAVLFLVGTRSIDRVTVEWLAHQYHLKPATAASLLAVEKKRRGDA